MTHQNLLSDPEKPESATRLREFLTYAGAIPFMTGAILLGLSVERIGAFQMSNVLAAYGLTIASFMAGTHWGHQVAGAASQGYFLYLSSIGAALCAWGAHVVLPERGFLIVLTAVFAALLAIDARLAARGVISQRYWRLRLHITAIVIASLLAAVFLL
jgi:hypothetical protein